ncbi:MAG TPA: amidohydrolase [Anaeromyxobacteraceae bacterium]|nr:amidohydrolase [Anaeromyxobacteraceae bacterium]
MIALLAAAALAALPPADVVYVDGPILTMVEGQPTAEALAVRNGRIAAVGKKSEVLKLKGPATKVVTLGKRALLPAFVDPHSHFLAALVTQTWANVSLPPVGTVRNIPDLVAVLRRNAAANRTRPGEWIFAWGYDATGLAEQREVTRRDLDAAFPDNPVMLLHVSGHGAVFDTRAMEILKLGPSTVTPPGGIIAREPGSQQPAGLVMEMAFLEVEPRLPLPGVEELTASLGKAQELYLSQGYTVATEGATPPKAIPALREAARNGLLVVDVMALPLIQSAPEVVGKPGFAFGTTVDHVKVVGLKAVVDGSPQGGTGFYTKPYLVPGPEGQSPWSGEPSVTLAQLVDALRATRAAGGQLFGHANGDAAIDLMVKAQEGAGVSAKDDARTVVVHSQFVRPDQLDAYVRLGLVPSFFTNHTFYWGDDYPRLLGEARGQAISPTRSAATRGIRFTNHTDYLVTPLDSMFTVWSAVNRVSKSGKVIGPDERIPVSQALRAITADAAWQYREEGERGTLEAGKVADLVLLSANPLRVDPRTLREVKVLETVKAGRTVWRRPVAP